MVCAIMSSPIAHDRTRKEDVEDDDPIENMIKKTGCLELHYAVQECMADHQDWRKCQNHVTEFRQCMAKYQMASREKAKT